MKKELLFFTFLTFHSLICWSQVTGGNTTFDFLNLPNAPHITALGNDNISIQSPDISMVFQNPALLRPEMNAQLALNDAVYFGGVNFSNLMVGFHSPSINTNIALGVDYVDYGTITQTDASGNILGDFHPNDFMVQVSGSRKYLNKWYYGVTMKIISSNYSVYSSSGIALDVGVNYLDTTAGFQVALVAKNMGFQLKKYSSNGNESLPFDLQLGVAQKLHHVPLQLSATINHLYQFDIRYADPGFNLNSGQPGNNTVKAHPLSLDNFFRHFVFAAELMVGTHVEITGAFNYLRRQELSLAEQRGVSGFSMGVGILLHQLQIRYARSYYQSGTAFNQLGIDLKLNDFFKFGKLGRKIGW
ncbi:MAG: type IX secretion system protein PorQ [Chitinophagaceae bacterium]